MIKETIKYIDFNDVERVEDFYFHLSKQELIQMVTKENGNFLAYLERISSENQVEEIYKTFKDIALSAVGKKSDDGRRFVKNEEIRKDFEESPAFDEFIISLIKDSSKASDFVNGLVPKNFIETMSHKE